MKQKHTIKTLKRNQKNYPLFLDKLVAVFLIVLIQLWFMLMIFFRLHEKYMEIQFVMSLLSILVVVYIINRPINPSYKLAWCITILFIPVFGGLFYLLLSVNITRRKFRSSIRNAVTEAKTHLKQDDEVLHHIESISKHAAPQAAYIHNSTEYPVYENTSVEYYASGDYGWQKGKRL